jgi:predicted transcriptional regulator
MKKGSAICARAQTNKHTHTHTHARARAGAAVIKSIKKRFLWQFRDGAFWKSLPRSLFAFTLVSRNYKKQLLCQMHSSLGLLVMLVMFN